MSINANIPADIDYKTGWAVAAMAGDTVVAICSLEVGYASEINAENYQLALNAIKGTDEYSSAEKAADAAYAAMLDAEDDEAEALETAWEDVRFRACLGMASGGSFTHTFSKAEAKRAGLPKNFR